LKTLIIIPTYNEIDNITKIIPAVYNSLPETHILVVDDNSPDGTGNAVKRLQENHKSLFLLERTQKSGLAAAYINAFKWALGKEYQIICEFDSDFSHKPEYLAPMKKMILEGADFVVGSRYVKGGGVENWNMQRKFISRCGSLYAQAILGGSIKDLTGGFNMWKSEILKDLPFDDFIARGYLFQIEMKHRARYAGFKGKEFPIVFPDRVAGESKMSKSIFMEAAKEIWKIKIKVK
jgi:dolichol-phosphate mannosyltransferase